MEQQLISDKTGIKNISINGMNKIILLIIAVALYQAVNAHETDSLSVSKADSFPRINEISWVWTEIIDGGLHLRYERKLGEHISAAISFGIKGEEGLVNLSGINTPKLQTSDITYAGFKILPEVRYYLSRTQQYNLDGFYFGAYMKYTQYNSDLFGVYTSDEGQESRIDIDASLQLITLGLGIGYKLALGERWNMDFMIAGPGATRHRYKLKNNLELPDEFYEDIIEALEDYSFFDYLNSDFKFDVKDKRAKFLFPTFRYGVTIGYTFSDRKNRKK